MRKMKRLMVVVGMSLLIAGVASSAGWCPLPDPPSTPHATVLKEGHFSYWCNGAEPVVIPIQVIQNIHQWLYVHWQPTKITWDVYKPGCYATNCLYSKIVSNGNVKLILTNNCPIGVNIPIHTFFVSGPHSAPYPVPDVIYCSEISKVLGDLANAGLLLIPPVGPGASGEICLLGCTPYILKLWDILDVGFHTPPSTYECNVVITIIKGCDD